MKNEKLAAPKKSHAWALYNRDGVMVQILKSREDARDCREMFERIVRVNVTPVPAKKKG